MNTEKLRQLIDHARNVEDELQTQNRLQELNRALQNIVNAPQEPSHQDALAENLAKISLVMEQFQAAFSPQDFGRLQDLAPETFATDIPIKIKAKIEANPMSPNVAKDYVQEIINERNMVFTHLNQMSDSMKFFEFDYDEIDGGYAEVGFQIPRELFENNLEGLITELNQIKRMVRIVSEAMTGAYKPPKVGTISTSDPLIFLELAVEVAKYFGGVVTWGIAVWYSVEKIRKVRAETAQIDAFTDKEIADIFDNKIQQQIDEAVEAKVKELLSEGKPPKGRKGDLSASLKWVLEALLAKMERGLTVELRIPPPPEQELDDDGEQIINTQTVLDHLALEELQRQLSFPEPSEEPILALPSYEAEKKS